MRTLIACAAVLLMTVGAQAEDAPKSGLQAGQGIGAFNVVKVAGASEDDAIRRKVPLFQASRAGSFPKTKRKPLPGI